jgi:Protein of unknown function (DUF3631)
MHSHAFGAAETTPYMLVTAPTPEAGKSRIIDVARYLVLTPEIVHDPTPAALFRTIDLLRPTLFIDEADTLATSKAFRAVLNSGYRVGGSVARADGRYVTYCPKLLAGIAGRKLPITGATLSRCVEIPMARKAPGERAERFRHRVADSDCAPLRAELVRWAAERLAVLSVAEPAVPGDLSDRQAECWEPLLAIADDLGGDWPERARTAAMALAKRAAAPPDDGTQIIADLAMVWQSVDGERAHTAVLAAQRNALEERHFHAPLSAHELSVWLGRFDIRPLPNPFRHGGKLARGYARSAFEDAFSRYARNAVTP